MELPLRPKSKLRNRFGWFLILCPAVALLGYVIYQFGFDGVFGFIVLCVVAFLMVLNGICMVLDGQ